MDQSTSERRHFFGAARMVAALTVVSRILGMVRDMIIVPIGGATLADRFWTAYSVPSLFRRLFGEGALSAAFVPVFTDVAQRRGWDKARMVLANAAGVLAALLAAIIVLVLAGLWIAWTLAGGDWTRMVLLQLTALMLPFMFTICLLALGSAALNCKGHFAYPAFAPIMLNVVLIITAAFVAPAAAESDAGKFFVIAGGLLVAGAMQLAGVVWLLKRAGLAIVPSLWPIRPPVRRIARLMMPMFVPLGVIQMGAFADRLIALLFSGEGMPLSPGVVRCLYAANRMYNVPLGILAISLATVVFPLFSRYASRNDTARLGESVNLALRLGLFMGIPAGVGLIILSEPATALIFQRRNFSPEDTRRAAFILRMYCIGMWAYFIRHTLLRAFFAVKDVTTPLKIAGALAVVNVAMVLGLIFTPLRAGAIGLATAVTAIANVLILAAVLHRKLGRIGAGGILASLARTLGATACMAAAVLGVRHLLGPTGADAGIWQMGKLVAGGVVVGVVVFIAAARILGCDELKELLARRK